MLLLLLLFFVPLLSGREMSATYISPIANTYIRTRTKTDPYEMGLKIEDRAFAICDCGTPGTYTARKGRFVLYIKKRK